MLFSVTETHSFCLIGLFLTSDTPGVDKTPRLQGPVHPGQ